MINNRLRQALDCLRPASSIRPPPRRLPPAVLGDGDVVRTFSYGSNMLRSKLEGRAGQALSCEAAIVDGYRLAMNLFAFPPFEPAMASIEPCEGDACEGALYELARADYERLWVSEGGG